MTITIGWSQVIISEFLASNLSYMHDDYGEYDDLIELYNPSDDVIDLSGYYLSDNTNDLTKWMFQGNEPTFLLEPGSYLILWADNQPEQGLHHLSFSLDKNGETILLIEPDGQTIVDEINYSYQRRNVSMGREYVDNNNWLYYDNPSIGFQNPINGHEGLLEKPDILSQESFIDQSISVPIDNFDPTQTIHYSLNQSHPQTNDPIYVDPINITETTVLNVKAFKDGFLSSETNSQLFIMNQNFSLPVLGILTDSSNLWDIENGIYTNFLNEGVEWEKKCINQYFSNNSILFSIHSGIRIQGRSSRSRPKKSFRLFYKNAYDQERLEYPVFGENGPQSYKNLVLRAGYDDDIQMGSGTLIRDPLVTEIWKELGMLASRGNFSNLYLNHQYWGIYNIRESVNEHFIKDNTGYLDFDLIRYLKWNIELKHGTIDEWNEINSFVRNTDFSVDQNYIEAVNKIDMENFLNLQALIICAEYRSWTWGSSVFREKSTSGKWRWTIWDMDRAFTNVYWNGFTNLDDTTGLYKPNIFTNRLLKNTQFKFNFINRIADFLNSVFKPENVISKIDSLEILLEEDIVYEAERWGRSTQTWQNNINSLRTFSSARPSIVKEQMINYFSLDGESEIIVNSDSGGYVRINSLSISQFPWEGNYFNGVPIAVEAVPFEGYTFDGWIGDQVYNLNPITIVPNTEAVTLHAQFSLINTENSIKIISPLLSYENGFHPLIFRHYDHHGKILLSNHPIAVDLTINGNVIESAFKLHKGVGSYLLDTDQISGDLVINIDIADDTEISETNLSQFISTNTLIVSEDIPAGETIWVENSNVTIDNDLYIPSGSFLKINKGSHIKLGEHSNIIIHGEIEINGTEEYPVLFTSLDTEKPWGGIEFYNSESKISYCFFINAGGDPEKGWQHTQTQPILFAKDNSELDIKNVFILNSPGKALGSHNSIVDADSSVLSFVFHGGEFHYSHLTFNNSYVINIPNDDGIFVNDDNDGFHIDYRHQTINEPSYIKNSFFINGKDDAIDHHRARINIDNCWIDHWMNEGIATSGIDTVRVTNTIVQNCSNGYEAGWGAPKLFVDHSVAINNGTGYKFGDNYSTPSTGQLTITNSIAYNNEDNIKNYTNHLSGPYPDGIDVSFSITNDSDYDNMANNLTGIPVFQSDYKLYHYSLGASMATGGKNIGIVEPLILDIGPVIINEVMYKASPDYDSGDWIELYNPSTDTINISSWVLKDNDDDHFFQFPEESIIPDDDFLVICRDINEFLSVYNHDLDILGDFSFGYGLGDQVRLFSATMSIVDSIEYGVNDPWPTSPNGLGPSLELIDIYNNELSGSWEASLNTGGTPGFLNGISMLNNLKENEQIPLSFNLEQNYPNPFNDKTFINYTLIKDAHVKITVYDITGREIAILVDRTLPIGNHMINWNAADYLGKAVSTGIYFYQLNTSGYSNVKKMLYVK